MALTPRTGRYSETASLELPANTALLVVDVQIGLDDPRYGQRNNRDAESNIARLLAAWRLAGRPIVHVQHMSTERDSPLRPELPGNAIKPVAAPMSGEPLVRKTVNSAFVGTALEGQLRAQGIEAVVVTGTTTDHCVSSTARSASDLGFVTVVVSDATATFERRDPQGQSITAELMHQAALASLQDEFGAVVSTDQLLAAFEH
ncbi:MAG: cysteine hydrolase family protein [Gemmatimonadota bacterium]